MIDKNIRQKVLFCKRNNPMFTVELLAMVCGVSEAQVREVFNKPVRLKRHKEANNE